jgi:hypothetical protein
VIDKTQEDAAVLGVALPETEPKKDFEVFKENMPAVELFLRVQTQWRTSVGGVTGLDYASVISTAKLYSVEDLPSVLEDLQIMEATAMAEFNKETK